MSYKIRAICSFTMIITVSYYTNSSARYTELHPYATLLWYAQPAANWNEALPIGNGRMGAMIYGGVKHEHYQLNEQTLWSGGPRNWNNPGAKKYLALVRAAALKGDYKKADSLSKHMQGPYTESYLPMADLFIDHKQVNDSSQYRRDLNIDSAIAHVQFNDKGKTYYRSAFSSFPDKVIVIHEACSAVNSISFTASLSSKLHCKIVQLSDNHIVLRGKAPKHVDPAYLNRIKDADAIQYAKDDNGEGMTFETDLYIQHDGGTVKCDGKSITVTRANAVTIIVSAATSYNGYNKSPGLQGKDPSVGSGPTLDKAISQTYSRLLNRHIHDYQPIFRRVKLNIGQSGDEKLPTNERLKKMAANTDPEMVALIFQYGRYLLIAGSRPGGLPVNLKGIWNDRVRPEYSSNWCIDHDTQMFYYGAESTNLPDIAMPLMDFITSLAKNGKVTARVNYGMRGWCAHHNTDIWRQTGPVGNYGQGNPQWATWNMSGPWLCGNLFDHYLFTGDRKFLRNQAWPVMKGAAIFCLDWLVKDKQGRLISVPSVSPENTFITARGDTAEISISSTGDIALMRELFSNCIKAASVLHTDAGFAKKLKEALTKLMPYQVGKSGNLQEWYKDWRPVDPAHRHLTHMYPVFPGNEISPYTTPKLAEAAKVALTMRKKTNCTWGFPLKAACWARLGEADSAWATWKYQLHYVDPKSKSSLNNYGLFPNLFNSDGPDVIMNGNGCATAVLTEMLLQSRPDELILLPALPKIFPDGTVKGLCARGGFVVDINWNNSSLKDAVIFSKLGHVCNLRVKGSIKVRCGTKPVQITLKGNSLYTFNTEKGKRYVIDTF